MERGGYIEGVAGGGMDTVVDQAPRLARRATAPDLRVVFRAKGGEGEFAPGRLCHLSTLTLAHCAEPPLH